MENLVEFVYENLYNFLGLLGVAFRIYCYGRVQWQRDYAKRLSCSVLNLLSAILVGISIIDQWNLAAFLINVSWGYFSLYGIYRCLNYMRRAAKAAQMATP